MIDIDRELAQYIATALWTTNADHLDPEGTGAEGHLDRHFSADDIAPEALASMREDLQNFINGADAASLDFWQSEHGDGSIGHDFWLTRNGHGAGFWDRWSGGTPGYAHGRHLTDEAKPYGESYVYVGDDGRLYVG